MKRIIISALVLSLALTGIAFGQVKARDGVYFAQDNDFAPQGGWKEQVVVTVAGGKITASAVAYRERSSSSETRPVNRTSAPLRRASPSSRSRSEPSPATTRGNVPQAAAAIARSTRFHGSSRPAASANPRGSSLRYRPASGGG